jgi:hypothetical protein
MAKRTKKESADETESLDTVKAALFKALGKPKRERGGIACYPAPDAPVARAWIARVEAAGGSASLADAYPKRVLAVVDGPPSGLMGLVTWVSWQFPRARKALDMLDRDAGLRVANIKYTDFLIQLARVPKDPEAHAKRLAKCVMMGDEAKIAASLRKRRWHTSR